MIQRHLLGGLSIVGILSAAAVVAATLPGSMPASGPSGMVIGKDTTYVMGPVNPDGTINYVAAYNDIYGKGVTPRNNSAVLIVRAVGPEALPKETRTPLLKAMGLSDLPEEGEYLEDFVQSVLTKNAATKPSSELIDSLTTATTRPATEADDPEILAWLKKNEKPLDLLVEASRRPRYFVPWVSNETPPTMWDGLMRGFGSSFRATARALAARAMVKADKGDIDGSAKDLLAIHHLARLQCQGGLIIDYLVALAVDRIATGAEQGIAKNVPLTSGQARTLLTQVKALPPLPPVFRSLTGERLFILDMNMLVAGGGFESLLSKIEKAWAAALPSKAASQPTVKLPRFDLDLNEYLRTINKDFDRTAAAMGKTSFAARKAALEEIDKDTPPEVAQVEEQIPGMLSGNSGELDPYAGRKRAKLLVEKLGTSDGRKLARALARLELSGGSGRGVSVGIYGLSVMCRADHELSVICLALSAYRADNGKFPQTLDKLMPAYLPAVPADPFTDKPIHYVAKGKGYLLYSVGRNLRDDKGQKDQDWWLGSPTRKDDLAVSVP